MGACNILCCDGARNKDDLPLDEQPKLSKLKKKFAEDYAPSDQQTDAMTSDAEAKESGILRDPTGSMAIHNEDDANQINSSTMLVERNRTEHQRKNQLDDSQDQEQNGLILDSINPSEVTNTEIEAISSEYKTSPERNGHDGDQGSPSKDEAEDQATPFHEIKIETDEDGQGSEQENEVLVKQSSQDCLVRWYRKDDYQMGFLQLISLEPLQQLHLTYTTPNLMKPYANKDEQIKEFEDLFPSRKEDLKIIVAEVDNRIVFALNLFIQKTKSVDGGKTGQIYDLLINSNFYSQLESPQDIVKKMITALENLA